MASGGASALTATLARPAGFRAVLEIVSNCFDDACVCLEATPAGISCSSVDQAHSSFIDAFFDSQGSGSVFQRYTCNQEHLALHVNPKHLARLLKATAGAAKLLSTVTLHVGAAEDRLTMRINSLSKQGLNQSATYHIALLHVETGYEKVTVDGSEFSFTAEAMTTSPAAVFTDAIAQLKASGCAEVELRISAESLVFSSRGADLLTECEIALQQHPEGGKLCLAAAEECRFRYCFKFFERIAKLAAVSTRMLVQLGTDAPLSVIADLVGGGYAHVFIAPLTEVDEDA